MDKFQMYLCALKTPYRKLCKIDFLQPDNSVAFTLDNNYNRAYSGRYDSRAFVQDGNLSVNLQNGMRRQASVTLSNLDGAFDYNINNIWFGQRIRLSMGLVLPDNTDFYLPQGVFYISRPKAEISPVNRSVSLPLVDKWAYLDGTLFGNLENSYQINRITGGVNTNVFEAMASILRLSKYDFSNNSDFTSMIDNVPPIFTPYYNGKTYQVEGGGTASMLDVPYTIIENGGGNFANILLALNDIPAGLIGYDATGALRVEPSQDDVNDSDKPVLWHFDPNNSVLSSISEEYQNDSVYNDIIIASQNASGYEIWGRARNYDPASDTNINIIGDHVLREDKSEYWTAQQCADLAKWRLKRQTILQRAVTISSAQMFHLSENRLISVKRTDKAGEPTEKHIIQSFSIPIGEQGEMTINATSVTDIPDYEITTSLQGA